MTRGITETPPHQDLTDAAFAAFCAVLATIFQGLDGASTINEAPAWKAQIEQAVYRRIAEIKQATSK